MTTVLDRPRRSTDWRRPDPDPEGLDLFRDDPTYLPRWKGRPVLRAPRPRIRPAAGLLPRFTDTNGEVWVLLGLRTWALGGTWSNLGGSLNHGEHPLAGAVREFVEETGLTIDCLGGGSVAGEIQCGTDRVPYTLFVVDVNEAFDAAGFELPWENDDLAWWRVDDVDSLRLHDGFRRAWEVMP